MPAIKTPKKHKKLREQFEANKLTYRELGEKWEISTATLRRYVKVYSWSRKQTAMEIEATAEKRLIITDQLICDAKRKELVEAGGNELYNAVVNQFKNADKTQILTNRTLHSYAKVLADLEEGADVSQCKTAKDIKKAEDRFHKIQSRKLSFLWRGQSLLQMAAKASTDAMSGVRMSLGLSNGKDQGKETGDTYNFYTMINANLQAGKKRLTNITKASDVIAQVDPLK